MLNWCYYIGFCTYRLELSLALLLGCGLRGSHGDLSTCSLMLLVVATSDTSMSWWFLEWCWLVFGTMMTLVSLKSRFELHFEGFRPSVYEVFSVSLGLDHCAN